MSAGRIKIISKEEDFTTLQPGEGVIINGITADGQDIKYQTYTAGANTSDGRVLARSLGGGRVHRLVVRSYHIDQTGIAPVAFSDEILKICGGQK